MSKLRAVLTLASASLLAISTAASAQQTPTPSFSVPAGQYSAIQTVAIADADPTAKIYFTANGATPTATSTRYTKSIEVRAAEKLQAIAIAPGSTASAVASVSYTFVASAPAFNPPAGTYSAVQSVAIASPTTTASIFYTLNGKTPTVNSPRYTGPISVSSTETITAIAAETGFAASPAASASYVLQIQTAAPVISPQPQNYQVAQKITLKDSTSGAIIYYTTDGSEPGIGSQVYSTPIPVSTQETVRAIAAAPGYSPSPVVGGPYVIEVLSTLAGDSGHQFTGDGGPASAAEFFEPGGIAFDPSGDLYIADSSHDVIRKISGTTGIITTVAGQPNVQGGYGNYGGDGKPALQAQFDVPSYVAFDADGNLYISDTYNSRIRKVSAKTGIISTVAGITYERAPSPNIGGEYGGDNGPATDAALNLPAGLAVDSKGNLYIADQWNAVIRKVDAVTGIITTVAGNAPYGLTNWPYGVQAGGFGGDGGPATEAQLLGPASIAFDSHDNLYIADYYNNVVRKVDAESGIITTIAGVAPAPYKLGSSSPTPLIAPTAIALSLPSFVLVDSADNLYIAEYGGEQIVELEASTGVLRPFAGNGHPTPTVDGLPAIQSAIEFPFAMTFDSVGNLYFTQQGPFTLRKVVTSNEPAPDI